MGVLNVTPDSFSDGGLLGSVHAAVEHGLRLVQAGADMLDVGGESTRPLEKAGVSAETEKNRVLPVIEGLAARAGVPVSVDTTKAEVAAAALSCGAEIVNDISGGLFDARMLEQVEAAGAAYVCGHVRGGSIAEVHAGEASPPGFEDVARDLADRLALLSPAIRAR